MFATYTNYTTFMISFLKKFPLAIFILILVIWIANYFLIEKFDESNEIGDSYGALNTLFSGLAFAGIIISIFMQNDELKLQREELELQRQEIINNRKELEKQANSLSDSARISALTSLLQHYQTMENQSSGPNKYKFADKKQSIVNSIDAIYKSMGIIGENK